MKKLMVVALMVFGILAMNVDAHARGRTGSFRVGGYNSHGLGSHYYGGW